jgi:hypothetical protein
VRRNIFYYTILFLLVLTIQACDKKGNSVTYSEQTEATDYYNSDQISISAELELSDQMRTYMDDVFAKLNNKRGNSKNKYEIVDIIEFKGIDGEFALIEVSIGIEFPPRFYLYSKDTGSFEFVRTHGIVKIEEIINENEFLFINSSGKDLIKDVVDFPYLVRCKRITDPEIVDDESNFLFTFEALYIDINTPVKIGAGGRDLINIETIDSGIMLLFDLYPIIAYPCTPYTEVTYDESKSLLLLSFTETNLDNIERTNKIVEDINNAYVNKVILERDGNNCLLSIELKPEAKYYNMYEDSVSARNDKLLIVGINFKTNILN